MDIFNPPLPSKDHTHITWGRTYGCSKGLALAKAIEQFSGLDDWEQNGIIASLQRVARMMDAHGMDASPVLDVGALDRGGEPKNLSVATGGTNIGAAVKADGGEG